MDRLPEENNTRASSDGAGYVFHQRISVPYDYPVYFTRGVVGADNDLLADILDRRHEGRRHRVMVFVDSGVAATHENLIDRVREYFHRRLDRLELAGCPEVIPGGENAKNGWQKVRDIMFNLGSLHLDRQSFVLAIGGGSLLDMIGFATSIVHRGLRLVRMPTTTLAQNDAGVGVKNGMNEHRQKNFVGTFAPPFAVINDFDFLPTLKPCDWIGGVAEAFKVALIKDAGFFDDLCASADRLAERDLQAMQQVVRRCAVLHLQHIHSNGDPFEFGSARPLDFGHWAAHKLETLTDYRLGHGQCVAIGLALDSYYAMRHDLLAPEDLERIIDATVRCGLPIWTAELGWRDSDGAPVILEGLEQFREHLGGRLTVTLPNGVGQKCEVHAMNPNVIEEGIGYLEQRAKAHERKSRQ